MQICVPCFYYLIRYLLLISSVVVVKIFSFYFIYFSFYWLYFCHVVINVTAPTASFLKLTHFRHREQWQAIRFIAFIICSSSTSFPITFIIIFMTHTHTTIIIICLLTLESCTCSFVLNYPPRISCAHWVVSSRCYCFWFFSSLRNQLILNFGNFFLFACCVSHSSIISFVLFFASSFDLFLRLISLVQICSCTH